MVGKLERMMEYYFDSSFKQKQQDVLSECAPIFSELTLVYSSTLTSTTTTGSSHTTEQASELLSKAMHCVGKHYCPSVNEQEKEEVEKFVRFIHDDQTTTPEEETKHFDDGLRVMKHCLKEFVSNDDK